MRSTSRCGPPAARKARPAAWPAQRCLTHDLWAELGEQIRLFLGHDSLADVVAGKVLGRAAIPHAEAPNGAMTVLYLDANATEPLRPEARAAVLAALDAGGNPSSVHGSGRAARRRLEDAREVVATRFGASAGRGGLHQRRRRRPMRWRCMASAVAGGCWRGATEHPAVLAAAGPDAGIIPVLADGTLDLAALEAMLAEAAPALVCLMAANNETGVLHPLAAAVGAVPGARRAAACRCGAGGGAAAGRARWRRQPGPVGPQAGRPAGRRARCCCGRGWRCRR